LRGLKANDKRKNLPMRIARLVLVQLIALCGLLPALSSAQSAPRFYLKNNDTVVFYGDSITEQNYYNQWVELYTVTRFPAMRIHFYGAGVGGDRVTGGSGGPIDERLARDVFSHHPTVVTVMLGMNDGSYRAHDDQVQTTYANGYQNLLESIHAHAPGVRVTLLGPSPFDDVTRAPRFPGGYNAVMEQFSGLDRGLARKFDDSFVDLNAPVVAVLEKANALDPLVARLLLPDRVHPETLVHWVMAAALLEGWNAPALVSSVTIDAVGGSAAIAENASVEKIERNPDGLRWTETEQALPLAFSRDNAGQALLLQLTDIQHLLNQEQLRVTGLSYGQYALKIDDTSVGTFSSAELSAGINLADYGTPMRAQSQRVGWLVRDRDEAHYIHMRMLIRTAETGVEYDKQNSMESFGDSLEDKIYETAAPKPHIFSLSRVVEPTQ
jgi:lysophospholipase L1-like esterase